MKALNTIDNASTAETVLKQCCKDDKFVDALHEGCQNVCTGAVRLHPDEHDYVRRYHTKLIEGLGDPKASRRKIRALAQQGGVVPLLSAILPSLITTVGGMVGSAVLKRLVK